MIKTISLRSLTACTGKYLLLSGSLIAIGACQPGSEHEEIAIEALPTASSLTVPPTAEEKYVITPDQPLQLNFNQNGYYVGERGSFLYRGNHTRYISDQGHLQMGSVLVTDRQEPWHGPLLRLPPLEARQAYRASFWLKPIDTEQPTQIKLILIRVAEGQAMSVPLSDIQAKPGVWQRLDGEFSSAINWEDDIIALSLEVDEVDTQYLIDDVMVAHAEFSDGLQAAAAAAVESRLRRYGDLEESIEPWHHQGGVISRSKAQANTGDYSLLISGRTESWHAPTIPLHGLEDNKKYKFSIFARLNEGEPTTNMNLTLKRITKGQTSYIRIASAKATSSEWVNVAGVYSSANISESEYVVLYLESDGATTSYFVDTLTVESISEQAADEAPE